MRPFQPSRIQELLARQEAPCVSLYQPTHAQYPDSQQDPIRYKNLLRNVENSLKQQFGSRDVRGMLGRFEALVEDKEFWKHRTPGLAILANAASFHIFDLPRTPPELAVVANSYHVKPLIRVLQSADRFQVLGISMHSAKLYEGNRDALFPVPLGPVPATITDALGEELTEPHRASRPTGQGTGSTVHYGQGSKKEEVDVDRERFFRAVDRGVLEHHSKKSRLPLILATLAEHHHTFRSVTKNPYLIAKGITANPEALTVEKLRAEAWSCFEPFYLHRLDELIDQFNSNAAHQMGSDNVEHVAKSAVAGRVGTLLVEADRQIGGRVDSGTGAVEFSKLNDPGTDDVLDDLAELVLSKHGDVVVVPKERMPTPTGLAATFRF